MEKIMIEEKVIKIIQQNTKFVDVVNREDRFREIGVDSLTYFKILVELEQEFGFELDQNVLSIKVLSGVQDVIDYVQKKL